MNIFFITFQSILTMLFIGIIGFVIIQRIVIQKEEILKFLGTLAIDISLPAMVFYSILNNFSIQKYPFWWTFPLWWVLFTFVSFILSLFFSLFFKFKRETFVSFLFPNGIFFPIVIIQGIFGFNSELIPLIFIFTMFLPAFLFSTGHIFFKTKEKIKISRILNPVLIATIFAIFLSFTGFKKFIPKFILNISNTLGQMTMPVLFLILGGNMYLDFKRKEKFEIIEVIKFTIIKNFIFPFLFYLILLILKPPEIIRMLILIQAVVPPITAIPVVVKRSGGNTSIVNQYVFITFVVSSFSIPLWISILNIFHW